MKLDSFRPYQAYESSLIDAYYNTQDIVDSLDRATSIQTMMSFDGFDISLDEILEFIDEKEDE